MVAAIHLAFFGDLRDFFPRSRNDRTVIAYPLTRRASLKDIIEALGIPHTEVGTISIGTSDLEFDYIPQGTETFDIRPLSPEIPVTEPSVLRPFPLTTVSFIADATVGKLTRLLRMAGIDTTTLPRGLSLANTAGTAAQSRRILLSRNRELLRVGTVVFGRLLRSQQPPVQFAELNRLFDLVPRYRPFSRCLLCNSLLTSVEKPAIIDRLEPLTRRYYDHFKQCPDCRRLFWQGSHYERMLRVHDLYPDVHAKSTRHER